MRYAILGGGSGAFAMAGHLALQGFEVSLMELPQFGMNIESIRSRRGINVTVKDGIDFPSGFARVGIITTSARDVVKDADVLCLTVPSFAHEAFAQACGPYLRDGQVVLLHPANPGGAFVFLRALKKMKVTRRIVLAEAPTLFYTCRKTGPTTVNIFGYRKNFKIAAFPAKHNETVLKAFKDAYPDFGTERNAFVVEMSNPNMSHVPLPLLNAGWIQSTRGKFLFYRQGVTEAISRAIDAVDKERLAIGRAMGMPLTPMNDLLVQWYGHLGVKGETTLDILNKNPVYDDVQAPRSLIDRYVTEDVPYGLVPLAAFGRIAKVSTPTTELMIDLAHLLTGFNFRRQGRTLQTMGIQGKTPREIRSIYETGAS